MRSLILFFLLFSSFFTFAQPGMEPPPQEIPITDHIEMFFVVGLLLGAYLIIRQNRKSKVKKLLNQKG